MGKPRKKSIGFSERNEKSSKSKIKDSESNIKKEFEAIESINKGELERAEFIYRELIKAGSKNHIVYSNLGVLCGMKGENLEMIRFLNQAIAIKPDSAELHNNLGNAFKGIGDITSATICYNKALEIRSSYPEAFNNLGTIFQEQNDSKQAIECYKKAIELKQKYPEALNNLGIVYQQINDYKRSIKSLIEAINIKSNFPDAHFNLGVAYQQQGYLNKAIECYKKVIEISPINTKAYINQGIAYQQKDELNIAFEYYNKALIIDPKSPEAHNNLGYAYKELGNLTASIRFYNKALELNENYSEARWNLATVQLLCGNYKSGWKNYEYRFKKENPTVPHACPSLPKWDGEKLSATERLLIISEQGLGDTLQFMRYIPYLRKQGFNVDFCAQEKLHGIIKESCIHPNPISPQEASLVSKGKWISLLSLPNHIGVSSDNAIVTDSYISSTDTLIKKWECNLKNEKKPIVGLNWQGNLNAEKRSLKGRSIPLNDFAQIIADSKYKFVSLQKNSAQKESRGLKFKEKLVDCQKEIDITFDFLETAAIIANCDLVVTSDTSMAHLAGGMGKATWLLLKDIPEWRWGMKKETTFWYPTLRLFRQTQRNNWKEVLTRVSIDLAKYFENH